MFRGERCRAINNRSYNAAFAHLGYGIACMTDDGEWENRTIVLGNYTNNCRHHVEHAGRETCTEIAYHTAGPKAPFSHMMDVHREGSRRTVWHHITIEGQVNNADNDEVSDVWNFRGTPLEYHEVYAVHFNYKGPDPPEEPETSNDGHGSEIVQTNQGLEDRYTWAENPGGRLQLDRYKDKDKPYSTDDTEGVKGADGILFLDRDNVYGGDAPAHVGSKGNRMWYRVKVQGAGNYRIEADEIALGDKADEGGGDVLGDGVAAGYVSNGVDVYYVQGGVRMSATDELDVHIGEESFTSEQIPDASQEPVADGSEPSEPGPAPPEVEEPSEPSDGSEDEDDTDEDENEQQDPLAIMNEQYDALAELSSQQVLDVSDGDDITDELEDAADDTDTLTVVPAGEYSTDYLDLDMNSCALIGEPGERVALEPNSSRDDAGEYFITIEGSVWAFSNFVLDFTEDGYGGRVQADGETFVVSDVRAEGEYPPESKGFSTDVNDGETGLIARCEVDGTEQDGTDTNGILVSSSHEGTVYLRDCRMGGFTNNAVYGSDPGRDYGNDGRVVVEGGKFWNSNVANVRIGSTDSVVREATVVVDERVKTSQGNQSGENSRGIRVRDRHDCLVEDCDVTYKEGGSGGNAAIAIHDEAGRATVRNCRVKTAGQLPHLRVEESGMSGDVSVLVEGCHFTGDGSNAFDLGRDDLTIRDCYASFETDVDGVEYAPDEVEEPSTEARTPRVDESEPTEPEQPEPEPPEVEEPGTTPWPGEGDDGEETPSVPDDPEEPAEQETRIYVEGDGSVDENVNYTIEVTGDARLGGLSGSSDNIVFSDGNTTIVGEVPADSDDDFFITGEIVSVQKHPALTVEIDGEPYTDTSRVYVFGSAWVNESDRGPSEEWKAYRVETSAGAEKDRKADEDDEIVTADGSASIRGVVPLNADDAFLIEGAVENIVAPPEVNFWIDGNDYVGSRELRSPEGVVIPGEPAPEPEQPEPEPEQPEPEPPEEPETPDEPEAPDESPDETAPPDEGEGEQPEAPDEPETPQPPSGEVPDVPEDAPDVPEIPEGVPTGDPSTLTRAELTAGFVAMLNSLDYFNQE
jgi:hypothetical protein